MCRNRAAKFPGADRTRPSRVARERHRFEGRGGNAGTGDESPSCVPNGHTCGGGPSVLVPTRVVSPRQRLWGQRRSVPFFLIVFLKLNAGVGSGHFAICVLGMPTDHERVRMRRSADGAGSRVGLRIAMAAG